MQHRVLAALAISLLTRSALATGVDGGVARTQIAQGTAALEAGRAEEARTAFGNAVASAPDWGLAHLGLGMAEQMLNPDSERARRELEIAVQLEPENPKAHYHLGLAYDRHGQFTEAAKQYAMTVQLRPQMNDAQFQLANALRMSGDETGAIGAFETLLKNEPTHVGALLAVAELYEKAQRYDDAEHALTTITRLQPSVAYHQYRLAKFYERTGNPRKAQMAFARADSLNPKPQRKMRPLLPSR